MFVCFNNRLIVKSNIRNFPGFVEFFHMLAQEFLAITVHVQGRFPLSRNFYVCTSVKLTCVNKTEAMYGRSRTNVKAELRPTSMFSRVLYFIYGSKNYATLERWISTVT